VRSVVRRCEAALCRLRLREIDTAESDGCYSLIKSKPVTSRVVVVARSERFELPTLGFEVRCSIQLSYERVSLFNGLATTPNFLALFWLWLLPLRSDS
jgi:hypothetical protein